MKSFAVIGCGRFGFSLATTLYKLGCDVIAIDTNENVIDEIKDKVTKAVVSDPDEDVLKEMGIKNCDVAIVSIGSDIEASVITTLLIKEIGVPYIVCKAGTDLQARILYKIGADKVILPEREMGVKLAKSLVFENILEKIDLPNNHAILELKIPNKWIGKNLIELDVRRKLKLNVVAIKKKDRFNVIVDPSLKLQKDWIILIAGSNENLTRFEKEIGVEIF